MAMFIEQGKNSFQWHGPQINSENNCSSKMHAKSVLQDTFCLVSHCSSQDSQLGVTNDDFIILWEVEDGRTYGIELEGRSIEWKILSRKMGG